MAKMLKVERCGDCGLYVKVSASCRHPQGPGGRIGSYEMPPPVCPLPDYPSAPEAPPVSREWEEAMLTAFMGWLADREKCGIKFMSDLRLFLDAYITERDRRREEASE